MEALPHHPTRIPPPTPLDPNRPRGVARRNADRTLPFRVLPDELYNISAGVVCHRRCREGKSADELQRLAEVSDRLCELGMYTPTPTHEILSYASGLLPLCLCEMFRPYSMTKCGSHITIYDFSVSVSIKISVPHAVSHVLRVRVWMYRAWSPLPTPLCPGPAKPASVIYQACEFWLLARIRREPIGVGLSCFRWRARVRESCI